jgi:hypothetical protein
MRELLRLDVVPRKGFKGGFFGIFKVLHSMLLHLPPLGVNCVGGCWDRTEGLLRLWHLQIEALTAWL